MCIVMGGLLRKVISLVDRRPVLILRGPRISNRIECSMKRTKEWLLAPDIQS